MRIGGHGAEYRYGYAPYDDGLETLMHTLTGTATSTQRPGAGDALYVRDRSTGELFAYPHRPGAIGPASYGAPVRIGTGFLPEVSPVLAAGDFHGDGGLTLLCGLPDGREILLPAARSFTATDLPRAAGSVATADLPSVGSFTAADLPPVEPASVAAAQLVVVRGVRGRPEKVLRAGPDGTVRLAEASAPDRAKPLTTIDPGTVLLGMGDVTGTGRSDLLLRRPDGGVGAWEFPAAPGAGLFHDLGADFDGTVVIAAADVSGDGLFDLLAVGGDGELLVFPHSGVFWPQDPATTFLAPIPVTDVGAVDIIG
ncbi:hypothetical protein ACIBQX_46975 [Nonomuraea sp. NPDC049714]|uniref:hypothetical protein n=1 Tax=Nonomuraea sp. NPDC049714 TaxID=3364357 RepID=UPI0037B3990E